MRLHAVAELFEALAPRRLAAEWDRTGWQVRLEDQQLRATLVSLDATPEVVTEAARLGANLLVTHHPLFFRPPVALDLASPIGRTAIAAARAGVSVFTLHTNLDAAPGGTSWALAEALGLESGQLLEPGGEPGIGYGVISQAAPRTLAEWAALAAERLGSAPLAVSGEPGWRHSSVAVMGGSGAGQQDAALAAGATLFLTADIRYHEAQQARAAGLSLIVLDHYASERPVLDRVAAFLREQQAGPVHGSTRRTTPWESERP